MIKRAKSVVAVLLVMVIASSGVTAWGAEDAITPYAYYAEETLPKIYIDTENDMALDDPSLILPDEHHGLNGHLPVYDYVDAVISVRDCEGFELENVEAQVKIRGNYTSTYPKRPIRIKFDEKQPMCGLNEGRKLKSWVLLAEYKDPSLFRNSAALYIANSLYSSTGNYASDFRNVEVYLNGEYNGLYVLAEQQQVNKYRVDVPEPEDPDEYDTNALTEEALAALKDGRTGYFIEFDGYYTNEKESETFTIRYDRVTRPNGQTFLPASEGNDPEDSRGDASGGPSGGIFGGEGTTRQTGFTIKSDIYFEEQRAFIQNTMQTVWDVLYDAVYTDHSDLSANPYHTMDEYGDYIADASIASAHAAAASVVDIDSLVDMYILQEICEDIDLDWSSFFFSIDMSPEGDHLLTYTAPWDFDSGFDYRVSVSGTNTLYAMEFDNPWLVLFYGQDWFWQLVCARWDEAAEAGVFTGVIEMMDAVTAVNEDAYARNLERWPASGSEFSFGASGSGEGRSQAQAEETLRTWLQARIENLGRLIHEMAER